MLVTPVISIPEAPKLSVGATSVRAGEPNSFVRAATKADCEVQSPASRPVSAVKLSYQGCARPWPAQSRVDARANAVSVSFIRPPWVGSNAIA